MEKEVVPKAVFENMIKHLVHIEEEKDKILSEYYSAITAERMAFELFITDYIKKIEEYIANCQASETVNDFFPRIIIGSTVEIYDMQYNEAEKYQVISPFGNNILPRTLTASHLSPMGRALLHKKPNETVIVDTPAGQFTYKILSIEMFEEPSGS